MKTQNIALKTLSHCVLVGSLLALGGCASILSESSYPVRVASTPPSLSYSVTNRAGQVVAQGTTPNTVELKAGAGYFKREQYTIAVSRGGNVIGTANLTPTTDGWYFGNILFGGLIGLIIVDPLTGAMWALPEEVVVSASGHSAALPRPQQGLEIASIESLTDEQRSNLEKLSLETP